jgi:hypothetical protein
MPIFTPENQKTHTLRNIMPSRIQVTAKLAERTRGFPEL